MFKKASYFLPLIVCFILSVCAQYIPLLMDWNNYTGLSKDTIISLEALIKSYLYPITSIVQAPGVVFLIYLAGAWPGALSEQLFGNQEIGIYVFNFSILSYFLYRVSGKYSSLSLFFLSFLLTLVLFFTLISPVIRFGLTQAKYGDGDYKIEELNTVFISDIIYIEYIAVIYPLFILLLIDFARKSLKK